MQHLCLSRICVLLIGLHFTHIASDAKDQWISVRSENFFLVGNDSEKDVRQVALKFEQFREAFSRILPKMKLNSSVPTRVLVFKNDNSFKPYKPLYQGKPALMAGFYQKGADVNHICLTSEYSEERPYAAIFHEYVHQLTGDNVRNLPVWFNEGIAEYYSTFEATDNDRKISLGKPISSHVYLLRESRFLPLSTLFAVGHDSPEYNERQKKGVFYAESWALVHYLMTGDNGKHLPKLIQYLNLLASGVSLEESFTKAFQTDYVKLERELRNYIQQSAYSYTIYQLDRKLEVEEPLAAVPLSGAEAAYYLGDLLLHTQRFEEAEKHLKQSLESNPNFGPALASMGTLCLHQKQPLEARAYFQKAVAADSSNYLVHYQYAHLLSQDGSAGDVPSDASRGRFRAVQAEAKKAIELAPWFVEPYRLLAYAAYLTGEELPATAAQLKKAQTYAPGRQDLRLDLARLNVRLEDYAGARKLLEPLSRQSSEPHIKHEAEVLLARLQDFEEQRNLVETARRQNLPTLVSVPEETRSTGEISEAPVMKRKKPATALPSGSPPEPTLQLHPPKGDKAAGILLRIDCHDNGVTFVVKSAGKTLRLYTADPEKILLYKESGDSLGTISMTCGALSPPSPVVATYREPTNPSASYDGFLQSVLFVNK